MTRRRPVPLQAVAYHEAGHALARWWLGFHTDKVTVLTVDQIRCGTAIEDRKGRVNSGPAGVVDGYDIHIPMAREILAGNCSDECRATLLRNAPRRAQAAVVELFAGSQAEASFRHCSTFTTYLFGGERDLEAVTSISREWFGSDAERAPFVNRAERLARELVRSTKGKAALAAMTAELGDGGMMDGERVEALCGEAYGGAELVFDRWAETWPPTIKQVREGYLPERSCR